MAITFEEKSNIGKNIAILLLFIAAVVAAGIWGFGLLSNNSAVVPAAVPPAAGIDKKVLEDPVLATLETFPEITPPEIESPSQNPFVEQPAPVAGEPKGGGAE